jgi:hypothetical protein
MSRNTRLWQDSLAVAISYEGDVTLGAQWLGYAKAQLNHMLQNTAGPLTASYVPTAEVTIRVDTRPNRIRIAAGGNLFVTIENAASGDGNYPVVGTPVFNKFKSRFLYKKLVRKSVDALYAGDGYHLASSAITTRAFWSDENTVAVSWTGSGGSTATIYLGGRWGQPTLPSGTVLSTCFIVPDKTIFPTGSSFAYVVGVLVEAVATKMNTLYFYGALKGSPVNIGTQIVDDRIIFFVIEGRASFQITSFSTGLPITTINTITNFTADAKKIAHIPIADQIKVLTFSDDYFTVVPTLTNTSALGSGTTFVQKIREEGKVFSFAAVTHAELGIGERELWVCTLVDGLLSKVLKVRGTVGVSSIELKYFSARFSITLANVSDSSGNETNRFQIHGVVINLFGTPPPDGLDWTSLSFDFANYAELKDTLVICAPKLSGTPGVGFTLVIDTISKSYQLVDPALDIFSDTTFGTLKAPVSLTHTKF